MKNPTRKNPRRALAPAAEVLGGIQRQQALDADVLVLDLASRRTKHVSVRAEAGAYCWVTEDDD